MKNFLHGTFNIYFKRPVLMIYTHSNFRELVFICHTKDRIYKELSLWITCNIFTERPDLMILALYNLWRLGHYFYASLPGLTKRTSLMNTEYNHIFHALVSDNNSQPFVTLHLLYFHFMLTRCVITNTIKQLCTIVILWKVPTHFSMPLP